MTYRRLYQKRKKHMDTISKFAILNTIIALMTLLFLMSSWIARGIAICGILVGFGILMAIVRSTTSERKRIQSEVLKKHGDEEVLAFADEYFGFVSTEKLGFVALILLYLAIVLLVFSLVYKELGISNLALALVNAVHVLMMVPLVKNIQKELIISAVFTEGFLILRYEVVIDLGKQMKYQFIEQVKNGYILEINTGERYSRLCLSDAAAPKAMRLLKESV